MLLKLERPIIFFDLETTGINPHNDRVIQYAGIKVFPDGRRERKVLLINPERSISPDSIAIHGITDADVAEAPTFQEVALPLLQFMSGCDLSGFGIERFDIPLLTNEFRRAGYTFSVASASIVDAQKIFHMRERRTLEAAVAFYCGASHADAHDAEADALASLQVLEGQLDHYDDLPRDVAGLDRECHPDRMNVLDREGKLRWSGSDAVIAFGHKSGTTLRELARDDPRYLKWILNKNFSPEVKDIVRDALEGVFPQRPESDAD